MVFITGDCHANWSKFSTDAFPEQRELTKDDFVIVCGDFGIWHDDVTERWWLKWLEKKSFTICFVDGNHENFDRLYSDEFDIVDFCGGKAHKIRNNIYHLIRGNIFDIYGKKFFAFGGASSHDINDGILDRDDFKTDRAFKSEINRWYEQGKSFRVNHISWWEREMPSQEEMDFGRKTLEENGNKVDFVVSHCCPQEIASYFSGGLYKPDELTRYFNEIKNSVDFKAWFFGHYHFDDKFLDKYIVLYDQIIRII